MIKQLVKGRVAVYIDASNMFYSQQTLKWNIDYKKLITYLERECKIVGVTIYFGKKANDKKQEKFLQKLEKFGYEVKTREVKYIRVKTGEAKMKGNLDAEMILDMVVRKDKYDTLTKKIPRLRGRSLMSSLYYKIRLFVKYGMIPHHKNENY